MKLSLILNTSWIMIAVALRPSRARRGGSLHRRDSLRVGSMPPQYRRNNNPLCSSPHAGCISCSGFMQSRFTNPSIPRIKLQRSRSGKVLFHSLSIELASTSVSMHCPWPCDPPRWLRVDAWGNEYVSCRHGQAKRRALYGSDLIACTPRKQIRTGKYIGPSKWNGPDEVDISPSSLNWNELADIKCPMPNG